MPQVVMSAKDGVDSMIETGNSVCAILTHRNPTNISQEAKSKLERISSDLKEVRDLLARESQEPTSARAQRPSTRYA